MTPRGDCRKPAFGVELMGKKEAGGREETCNRQNFLLPRAIYARAEKKLDNRWCSRSSGYRVSRLASIFRSLPVNKRN